MIMYVIEDTDGNLFSGFQEIMGEQLMTNLVPEWSDFETGPDKVMLYPEMSVVRQVRGKLSSEYDITTNWLPIEIGFHK